MDLLIDANVLIDYLGRRHPFYEDAAKVIAAGYFEDANLWIPAQSVTDIFYILKKHVNPIRLQRALEEILEIVKPVSLSDGDLVRALRLSWPDLEDCLIAQCATKVNADYIITRDSCGFVRSNVPALFPAEWLVLQASTGVSYEEIPL